MLLDIGGADLRMHGVCGVPTEVPIPTKEAVGCLWTNSGGLIPSSSTSLEDELEDKTTGDEKESPSSLWSWTCSGADIVTGVAGGHCCRGVEL